MNRKSFTLVLALLLLVGTTSVTFAQSTYTVDLSRSSQSAFKLFGSVASTNPIGTLDLAVERNGWKAKLIVVQGLGDQNQGDLVDYYDGIVTKAWESGNFSATAGMEFFYAPAQLGGASSTFISPLATVGWAPKDYFSLEIGAQYVGIHNTVYSGDRIFGWIQPTLSQSVGPILLSFSPGYVLGETGRSTSYLKGAVSAAATRHLSVYASYLEAESWGTGVPGMVPIDGTWTFGLTASF